MEDVYQSPIPYEAVRIHAAAVYCSDGRIGDHVDDFLHQGLGLPRYDRLACPGGPAALAGRLLAFWEARGVEEQLRFLRRVHAVGLVVLIQHEQCAYYRERLGIPASQAEAAQRADLVTAAATVQRMEPGIDVTAFFAHVRDNRVSFEAAYESRGAGAGAPRVAGLVRV